MRFVMHAEFFILKGQPWISLLPLRAQALNIILASALYYSVCQMTSTELFFACSR
jgi:hypothetical protein